VEILSLKTKESGDFSTLFRVVVQFSALEELNDLKTVMNFYNRKCKVMHSKAITPAVSRGLII